MKRASYFHFLTIGFPSLGVISPPPRMHALNLLPFLLSPLLQNNSLQGQITELHVAESVFSAQFPSYWTSHQLSPHSWSLLPPWYSFFSWLVARHILSIFLLFTGCSLSGPCWFLSSRLPPNVGGSKGSVLHHLLYTHSLGDLISYPVSTLICVPMIPYFMFPPKVSPGLQSGLLTAYLMSPLGCLMALPPFTYSRFNFWNSSPKLRLSEVFPVSIFLTPH